MFLSMNLLKLNHRDGGDDEETANKLISIYFAFFKLNAGGGGGGGGVGKGKNKKDGEMDSKLVSALLTGVNRAYPYARLESGKGTEHVETMFKIIHTANFNTSLQVLKRNPCSESLRPFLGLTC